MKTYEEMIEELVEEIKVAAKYGDNFEYPKGFAGAMALMFGKDKYEVYKEAAAIVKKGK